MDEIKVDERFRRVEAMVRGLGERGRPFRHIPDHNTRGVVRFGWGNNRAYRVTYAGDDIAVTERFADGWWRRLTPPRVVGNLGDLPADLDDETVRRLLTVWAGRCEPPEPPMAAGGALPWRPRR